MDVLIEERALNVGSIRLRDAERFVLRRVEQTPRVRDEPGERGIGDVSEDFPRFSSRRGLGNENSEGELTTTIPHDKMAPAYAR